MQVLELVLTRPSAAMVAEAVPVVVDPEPKPEAKLVPVLDAVALLLLSGGVAGWGRLSSVAAQPKNVPKG